MSRLFPRRLAGFVFFLSILLAFSAAINLLQLKPIGKARAQGNTYYVATNGNDSNPGTSSQPWRTIQKAANTVVGGDTVNILAGTYNEQVIPGKSGSSTAGYITYQAYNGATVTIDGSGRILNGGLFWINGKSYIKVSGLRVINAQGGNTAGIRLDDSSYIIIEKNYIAETVSSGIGVWSCNNVVVDGNEIYHANNGGSEENISVDHGYNVEIMNNNMHHGYNSPRGGEGINMKNGTHDTKVHDNIAHDHPKLCFGLDAWTSHTYNIEYFNNVAYNCSWGIIISSEQGGLAENIKVYNNIAYNNTNAGLAIPWWGGTRDGQKKNIQFINNTSYNNGYGFLNQSPLNENVVVRNNILSQNRTNVSIVSGAVTQTTVDYNLFFGSGGTVGTNPVVGDPLFVNPDGADFHLQSGSPAINAGSPLGAPNSDFDGNPRPQGTGYDIGAYEYGGTQPRPTSTPTPRLTPTPTPTPPPSFNFNSGWNQISWSSGLPSYTSKSSLEDINQDCGSGTGLVLARKNKDLWEEYIIGYGGLNFNLQNNQIYFINTSKSCNWVP